MESFYIKKIIILSALCLMPFAHAMNTLFADVMNYASKRPYEYRSHFDHLTIAFMLMKQDPNSFFYYLPSELRTEIFKFPAAQELAEHIHSFEYEAVSLADYCINLMNIGLDPDVYLPICVPAESAYETPLLRTIMCSPDEDPTDILKFIKYLLQERKANPNQFHKTKWPLRELVKEPHWSAHRYETITLLIQAGADVNAMDEHGNTILDSFLLDYDGDRKGIKILRDHGAKTSAELKSALRPAPSLR